jgi:hypothetical protein
MTISCSVCLQAAAIVSETDAAAGQTFSLFPACWTEYLHGLDAPGQAAGQLTEDEPVAGREWTCPTCRHRIEIAS